VALAEKAPEEALETQAQASSAGSDPDPRAQTQVLAGDPPSPDELHALRAELRALREARETLADSQPVPTDWQQIGHGVLLGGLDVSGLKRGLLALRVPGLKTRFRVENRLGFAEGEEQDASLLLRLLGGALKRREPTCLRRALLRFAGDDVQPADGVIVALPLIHGDQLMGALVLDDPTQDELLDPEVLDQLSQFAAQSAAVLAHRLARSGLSPRRAS
jgi:hypothetical protein